VKISLLVIRCQNIEVSKSFYQLLGLSFVKEKHGGSPMHYSCEHDGTVFELYPNKGEFSQDISRLGFKILGLRNMLTKVEVTSTYDFEGKKVYVLTDPDGRKVEISE